ncbi:hypothetical protein Q787_04450 [Ornithobacterium rhinotracheale H06-030791]|nr:hypothetical protein Q785_04575 [Ornithobacterium rhinotracheale ORT-UMN 88]KGB67370.1 hypothetical protein Q787_04450 [Ornithobacterium rhinotracheale H06-030791]
MGNGIKLLPTEEIFLAKEEKFLIKTAKIFDT